MPQLRRQLTLFLPEHERVLVDSVRQWLDPKQHAIISAHVTLCREAEFTDWPTTHITLSSLKTIDVPLAFGKPIRLEDGCILLPVQGSTTSYDALRQKILGYSCNVQIPHITLLHPRNSIGRNDDLPALCMNPFPTTVCFTEISVIEPADAGKWNVVDCYRTMQAPSATTH